MKNEIEVMKKRWGAMLYSDPAYNPNLSTDGSSFKLTKKSRIEQK